MWLHKEHLTSEESKKESMKGIKKMVLYGGFSNSIHFVCIIYVPWEFNPTQYSTSTYKNCKQYFVAISHCFYMTRDVGGNYTLFCENCPFNSANFTTSILRHQMRPAHHYLSFSLPSFSVCLPSLVLSNQCPEEPACDCLAQVAQTVIVPGIWTEGFDYGERVLMTF